MSGDRGATAVTLAISMLFLLGLAAVAVDGSNLYRERGDVQNAADLAALAAAYDECVGGADPAVVGAAQAAANGYTHDGSTVVVSVTKVGDDWEATVDSTIVGFFSTLLGADTLSTGATAVAKCTTSVVGGYALFAGGVCGQDTLDWSGSINTVTGGVHSNDGIDVSGSDNTVNGSTTSVSGTTTGGSGNVFDPPANTTGLEPWPQTFDADDFLPASEGGNGSVEATVGSAFYHFVDGIIDSGVLLSNGWMTGTVLDPGVYVATEDIDLSISNLSVDTVGSVTGATFVAAPSDEGKGIITMSGSDQQLDPFYESLLVFSDAWKGSPGYPYLEPLSDDPDCFDPAIKLSGSNQDWEGIMFAPRGMVDLSGATNVGIGGSIIAYTIRVSGSSQNITFVGSGGAGEPVTVLVK